MLRRRIVRPGFTVAPPTKAGSMQKLRQQLASVRESVSRLWSRVMRACDALEK